MYGQKVNTPIDLKFIPIQSIDKPPYKQQIQAYIDYITIGLEQVQTNAQQNIEKAQRKQKQYYDKFIKEKQFVISDKVLLYQSAQAKVHGDKFREKWKGPYYIHDIVTPRVYKLRTIDQKVLKKVINTDQLKMYFEQPLWEPIVIVEQ